MAETEDMKKRESNETEEKEVEVKTTTEMKPWEQHSAVISIPRYNYNAPSSLLHTCHSGFLITCPIKREKSATKEAISILEKYIESDRNDCLEESDVSENAKRRKLCSADGASAVTSSNLLEECPSAKTEIPVKQTPNLQLVKVTMSGLVLFTLPKGSFLDTVEIVSRINQSLESGELKRPLWCNRILPIQATCQLNEKEVKTTVTKLVLKFVEDRVNRVSSPIKFAVGYNRRGIEEKEMKAPKDHSVDPKLSSLLDRNHCFSTVAAAVKAVAPDSVVDLKSPEVCILVEVLPISGLPSGSLVTAASVLPRELVSTKPRLCIKALVSDSKAQKKGLQT